LSLDPLSTIIGANYAMALMVAHRNPEAVAEFQKILERDPSSRPANFKRSQLNATMGHFAQAIHDAQVVIPSIRTATLDAKGYCEAAASVTGTVRNTGLAYAFSLAGDRNRAFENLEKAYADGDNELLLEIRYPGFDPLRSDPRYHDLMRRLGLPE
jgi:tetratricopeptide (TPR) repeat protein